MLMFSDNAKTGAKNSAADNLQATDVLFKNNSYVIGT